MFERLLYSYYTNSEKEIKTTELSYSDIYLQHGCLLVELQKYVEARKYLEKAIRWNPVSGKIQFEYMETFKAVIDIDKFAELNTKVFQYAYTPEYVARCYRNMGYYFIEKKLYKEATACYLMSLEFDKENKNAHLEIYYIKSKLSQSYEEPTVDEIKNYSEKYGFPIGPHKDIMGLALAYGNHFIEEHIPQAAIYFLKIAYDLTEDEEIEKMISMILEN